MSETDGVTIERSPADVVRVVTAVAALLALLLLEWIFGTRSLPSALRCCAASTPCRSGS